MKTDSTHAPAGATDLTTIADADILSAWGRYQAAREAYDCDTPLGEGPATEKEMNDAEEVIRSTIAATPKGAEIQAWIALAHVASGRDADEAAYRGDLAWFDQRDSERDWVERLLLATIRSLRSIGGAA